MAGSSGVSYRDEAASWMHQGKRNGWTLETTISMVQIHHKGSGRTNACEPICAIIRVKYDMYKPRMTFYEKQMARSQV